MSSPIKSKDRTSSSGQKFWHLKKLALGKANANITEDQDQRSLHRPPSPAESAFSVDAISLCDNDSIKAKPKSKRLSGLLSHRRQASNASGINKVGPLSSNTKPNGMPTAMSVQNLSGLSRSPSLRSVTTQQQRGGGGTQQNAGGAGSIRQRTMSHTSNATSAIDARAAFLRTRNNNNNNLNEPLSSSPPMRHSRAYNKALEDETSSGVCSPAARKQTLRPAASMVNLKRAMDAASHQSPPLSPTSPTSPRLSSFPVTHQQQRKQNQMVLSPRNNQTSARPLTATAPNKDEDSEWSSSSSHHSHDDTDSMSSSSESQSSEESWRQKLEKEQAIVKALQRQKEACNKDIAFLSQSLDDVTNEKQALKQQLETEKLSKEKIQNNLSGVIRELEETRCQVKDLLSENEYLKSSLKEQQQGDEERLKKHRSDSEQETLRIQLRHTQDQVRVLKSTMEQFLRMGIFSDDMLLYQDIASRYGTQLRASSVECLTEQQAPPSPPATEVDSKDEELSVPQQPKLDQEQEQEQEHPLSATELDKVLRELLQEKELLQGEYSKIPTSGAANALTRRRKEELEARLDSLDSQISRIKLKYRDFIKK